ncbi:tripartite tricarboxylate transporter substrate binding protein [Ramlibacter sp. AN1015]|uniref:Bug family tripartite tricarboxylate transporter substrate binding protein n=1 Tax=Ramlibacter sp. AN1015 TaxID=3133428 RepID=UPI0030C59955
MHASRRHLLSRLSLLACALALPLAPGVAAAQDTFPSKPVRIVVPFAAGGGVDILTRVLAQHLSEAIKQPVTVDNRTGAGGNVGVELVAKAPPDGTTLVMATTGTHTINPGLYKSLPFDAEKDFVPITTVASVPNLLVVNPKLPATNVKELVALAKSQPGKLSYASFGNGTANHLSGAMFTSMAGIEAVHVPYKSAPQAVTDLIAGQTAFAFVNTPLALPHVRAGKLRALAVTGARRSAATPDYPTMSEAGVQGFVVESWYGLMAPAGTPSSTVERLHKEVLAVLAKPEVREFFAKQGADVVTTSPAEFAAQIKSEKARWADVIKAAGASID